MVAEDGDADGVDAGDSGLPTRSRTMSRSWIIMSRTTPMSAERKVIGADAVGLDELGG